MSLGWEAGVVGFSWRPRVPGQFTQVLATVPGVHSGVTEDRCHSLCSTDTPSLEGRERSEHYRPQRTHPTGGPCGDLG